MSPFWFVDVLVSPFWLVAVLVCRRFDYTPAMSRHPGRSGSGICILAANGVAIIPAVGAWNYYHVEPSLT